MDTIKPDYLNIIFIQWKHILSRATCTVKSTYCTTTQYSEDQICDCNYSASKKYTQYMARTLYATQFTTHIYCMYCTEYGFVF